MLVSLRSKIDPHNPKVAGSSPAPATKKDHEFFMVFFLFIFSVCLNKITRHNLGWCLCLLKFPHVCTW